MNTTPPACVALLIAGILAGAGCSGEEEKTKEPAKPIATVDGHPIPHSQFQQAFRARLQGADAQTVASPEIQRKLMRLIVISELIEGEWIEQEAAKNNVVATANEVHTWYDVQRAASRKARASGSPSTVFDEDIAAAQTAENQPRSNGRKHILQQKLVAKLAARSATPIPDERVRRYYEDNKETFLSAGIRYLRLIVTKDRKSIGSAKKELARGTPWRAVSRRFSVDDVYLRHENGQIGTGRGELAEPLNSAVFGGRRGITYGPIHTAAGWYLFRLTRIAPRRVRSFAEVRDNIVTAIRDNQAGIPQEELDERLKRRYRPLTRCAKGYKVPDCVNASPNPPQFLSGLG